MNPNPGDAEEALEAAADRLRQDAKNLGEDRGMPYLRAAERIEELIDGSVHDECVDVEDFQSMQDNWERFHLDTMESLGAGGANAAPAGLDGIPEDFDVVAREDKVVFRRVRASTRYDRYLWEDVGITDVDGATALMEDIQDAIREAYMHTSEDE